MWRDILALWPMLLLDACVLGAAAAILGPGLVGDLRYLRARRPR